MLEQRVVLYSENGTFIYVSKLLKWTALLIKETEGGIIKFAKASDVILNERP